FAQQFRGLAGRLVVLAERVGEARVRIRAYVDVGYPRQLLDIGAELSCAERTVQTDGRGTRVTNRVPERLGRLTRKRPARSVGDRAGYDQRQIDARLVHCLPDCECGGLRVERVENRLDQQQVDAALDQRLRRHSIGVDELIEIDVAKG